MCGIVATVGNPSVVQYGVVASVHRGPDAVGIRHCGDVTLGHTRLAIIDVGRRSDQPFTYGSTTISYNGEIWNYRLVRMVLEARGCRFETNGDTEVVAAAIDRWGLAGLRRLNGMFAVAWTPGNGRLYAARDRFGEMPLHYTFDSVASELKVLKSAGAVGTADWVPPGGLVSLAKGQAPVVSYWHVNETLPRPDTTFDHAAEMVYASVQNGVTERTLSDVPVCTLLSGGLDSTVVAWAAKKTMPKLVAYTAVQDTRSADLRAARLAADHIGCELREVLVPEPTRFDLARVVAAIEQPHKAQVEIGWPCLVLARRIREDGFKVVFSGEGSDELWGSYGFSYHGIAAEGFGPYRRRTFLEQHRKNFARCNKAFMTAGVECRLPFLHPPLVDLAWGLPESAVRRNNRPKAVLEEAFRDVLPQAIVDRAKVAFQDGLGMKRAAAAAVADPQRYYRAEYAKAYGKIA